MTERHSAYHEAGHVIVAVCIGDLPSASIIPGFDFDGKTDMYRRTNELGVASSLAGGIAVKILNPDVEDDGGCADREHIEECRRENFYSMSDVQWSAYLVDLSERVERLLHEEWKAVTGIAKALLEKKQLSGSEIEMILFGFTEQWGRSDLPHGELTKRRQQMINEDDYRI